MKTSLRVLLVFFLIGGYFTAFSCLGQNNDKKNFQETNPFRNNFYQSIPPGFHARLHVRQFDKYFHHDKSKHGFIYHMDTAVVYSNYINPQRHIYRYDTAGNRIIEKVEQLVNEKWQNVSKDSIVYDSVGNQLILISQAWDNNAWINSYRILNYFTVNHNIVDKVNENWQNDKWVPADSAHFIYDASGNKVAAYYAGWVDSTASWVSKTFQIFSYDTVGHLKLILYEKWYDTVWMDSQQVLYKYDSAYNLIQGLIQYYGDTSWIDYYRENYQYDSARERTSYIGQYWKDSLWVNDQHYMYYYNTFGQLYVSLGQNWADSVWVNFEKGQYTYDIFGGIETYLYQQWVGDSVWRNVSLSQYNYDSVGNAYEGNYFWWDTISGSWLQIRDGLLQMFYNYGSVYRFFTGYQVKITYNAPPLSTGVGKNREIFTQYRCWPNPARNHTTVSLTLNQPEMVNICLFNLTGKKVAVLYQGHLNKGNFRFPLVTTRFPSGLYFVSFISGQQARTIKLIIEN